MGVKLFKNLEREAAIVASHHPDFKAAGPMVVNKLKAEAALSKKTGHFTRSISTTTSRKAVKDLIIYSDDPAAVPIEYGHLTPSGQWVRGKYIFSRTVMKLKFGG